MKRNARTMITRALAVAVGLSALAAPARAAGPEGEALARTAIEVRRPASAFLMDAALAGSRLVAVGERGLVLLSDDQGASWRQARVPVSVGLTAVHFADERTGMAVGHGGVVLGTTDGGESWTRLLDGRAAAELALAAAHARDDQDAVREAARLVEEGPDKPLLDVLMLDRDNALVVGAYGLVFRTRDGGDSWQPLMAGLDNPDGLHYYAIARHGDRILLAGEQGLLNLSEDGGRHFRGLDSPYQGSFFAAELPSARELVVAGLRGNVWRSADGGHGWQRLASPVDASVTASALLPDRQLLLGTQAGVFLRLTGDRLEPLPHEAASPINGFVALDRQAVVLTPEGIRTAELGAPTK